MTSLHESSNASEFMVKVTNEKSSYLADQQERLDLLARHLQHIRSHEDHWRGICTISWNSCARLADAAMHEILNATPNSDVSKAINDLWIALAKITLERFVKTKDFSFDESGFLRQLLCPSDSIPIPTRQTGPLWLPIIQQQVQDERAENDLRNLQGLNQGIDDKRNEVNEQIKSFTDALTHAEASLITYKDQASKLETQFNFVGLAGAFKDLEVQKRKELSGTDWTLFLLGCAILAPLALSLFLAFKSTGAYTYEFALTLDQVLPRTLIILPIEIILIYFFRINLKNQLSLKAQLLQLQLRYSLCAFIEGYAEFAKKLDNTKLEKFEALIFSGLSPDPDNVPSTFDGMDQLVGLVRAARGEK